MGFIKETRHESFWHGCIKEKRHQPSRQGRIKEMRHQSLQHGWIKRIKGQREQKDRWFEDINTSDSSFSQFSHHPYFLCIWTSHFHCIQAPFFSSLLHHLKWLQVQIKRPGRKRARSVQQPYRVNCFPSSTSGAHFSAMCSTSFWLSKSPNATRSSVGANGESVSILKWLRRLWLIIYISEG